MDNQADLSNMRHSEFVKLESPRDLAQETDVLNHCLGACDRSNDKYIPAFDTVTGESYRKGVAGSSYERYKKKLESGESEFFSFRPKGLPQFTVEVDYTTRNNGRIVQAYGAEDRKLTREESGILKDFAVSRGIDTTILDAPFGWGGI